MKEFTEVTTIQVTKIRQVADDAWADDVEIAAMNDRKNLTENIKAAFRADDVVAKHQLFIRDVEG